MDRRAFLAGAATGAAVLGGYAMAGAFSDLLPFAGRGPLKHWAWLRDEVKALDDWRRSLASMKAAGIDAILIAGSTEFYRRAVPAAAAEGLELHAGIFTMMRGEHLKTHPDWYAVSRAGVSTAVKPPYVDYGRLLCPSRDEVRQWLAGYVRELAEIEGLAMWKVDALLPMVYHGFYKEEVPWVECATREGVEALAGRIPLFSGLYVPDLPPADLARAARFALAGGASGICLFHGNTLTPEHWRALTPVLAQKGGA